MNSEDENSGTPVVPDHAFMLKLAKAKMPFGKYAGRYLVDLPEHLRRLVFPKRLPRR